MSPNKNKNKREQEEKDDILTGEAAVEEITAQTTVSDILKDLEQNLAEQQDKYLRLLAEFDNYRRRTQAEKDGIYSDAFCSAISQLLPVFDNLERAVASESGDGLKKGLELVLKQLGDIYLKLGVAEIPAEGEKFDPNLHNAVLHIEDENFESNTIAEVLQKGYTINDRVVRHAMVKVAN